ncbi:MAG: zinc ribbon domain-containing protein [Halobacteriales archaeon]|nr:zinc ribbon domain-containing protein [Halobacteriales archaeon]
MTETELTYADWAEALREGELVGQECDDCGNVTSTPKAACTDCGSRALSRVTLPEEGTVYTETTVAVAPEGFEGGYKVGVVDLGEARVLGRLDDEAEIGDVVAFADVFEHEGEPAPVFESET